MRVDRAGVDVRLILPDISQRLLSRLHTANAFSEQDEQFVLGCGEVDFFTCHINIVARFFDGDFADNHPLCLVLFFVLGTFQQVFNPQNQLSRAEWFGNVIISSQFQAENLVNLACFSTAHHDWERLCSRVSADKFAHLSSLDLWDH